MDKCVFKIKLENANFKREEREVYKWATTVYRVFCCNDFYFSLQGKNSNRTLTDLHLSH